MPLRVTSLDHLVLTVVDIGRSIAFYTDALGMAATRFTAADGTARAALHFGAQKINLHLAGAEFAPRARRALPGTADLCFLTGAPLAQWQRWLAERGVTIEHGPADRTGACGPIRSIYLRDPDGNLIEVSEPA